MRFRHFFKFNFHLWTSQWTLIVGGEQQAKQNGYIRSIGAYKMWQWSLRPEFGTWHLWPFKGNLTLPAVQKNSLIYILRIYLLETIRVKA